MCNIRPQHRVTGKLLSKYISNTRNSVSSGYPNSKKWIENTRCSRVFLTDFKVFGHAPDETLF